MSSAVDAFDSKVDDASGEESGDVVNWAQNDFEKHRLTVKAIRKKRVQSASFSHSGVNGLTINGVPSDVRTLASSLHRSHISSRCRYGKNSKKSRDGRRIPSKRGGKNVENPTDVLDEVEVDHDDPEYDSDLDPVTLEAVRPIPSDEEFERFLTSIVNELFVHGKTQEVMDSLADFNMAAHQRRRIPYLVVTMALQHKQTQCELASELLSDLCGRVINQAHIQHGFALVLNELGEITIDFPKASEHVGRFIARAMVDDILPPKFIETQKLVLSPYPLVHCRGDGKTITEIPTISASQIDSPTVPASTVSESPLPDEHLKSNDLPESNNGVENSGVETAPSTCTSSGIGSASSLATVTKPEVAIKALDRAETLLTLSRAFARLDNIWGIPVGPRATELLKKKVQGLLKAYLETNDLNEATEALLELDSPHFHHELVFQAIVGAVELSTDDARERVVRLLQELCRSVVITTNQLELGIRRVYEELSDLQIDVPAAYKLMERFLIVAHSAGFVSKPLMKEMPKMIRKRFISETDSAYRSQKKHQLL